MVAISEAHGTNTIAIGGLVGIHGRTACRPVLLAGKLQVQVGIACVATTGPSSLSLGLRLVLQGWI